MKISLQMLQPEMIIPTDALGAGHDHAVPAIACFDDRDPGAVVELVVSQDTYRAAHRASGSSPPDSLCCTNPVGDSSRESSMVAGMHE